MPPIISIVGISNSGKTTLLEGLIIELKQRGYRVAVIKHASNDFEFDKAGKDSWRLSRAGSEVVAISSPHKLAVIKQVEHDLSPHELLRFIDGNYDLILTEGFKQSNNLKIEVHRKKKGSELLCSPKQLLAVVTDELLDVDVPQLTRDEIPKLADLIEDKLRVWQKEDTVDLLVNEAHIPLNPFIRSFMAKTLLGMVSTLKSVKEVNSLHLWLRKKD